MANTEKKFKLFLSVFFGVGIHVVDIGSYLKKRFDSVGVGILVAGTGVIFEENHGSLIYLATRMLAPSLTNLF